MEALVGLKMDLAHHGDVLLVSLVGVVTRRAWMRVLCVVRRSLKVDYAERVVIDLRQTIFAMSLQEIGRAARQEVDSASAPIAVPMAFVVPPVLTPPVTRALTDFMSAFGVERAYFPEPEAARAWAGLPPARRRIETPAATL